MKITLRTDGAYVMKYPDNYPYFVEHRGKFVQKQATRRDKIYEVKQYGRTLDRFCFVVFRDINRHENLGYQCRILDTSGEFFNLLYILSKEFNDLQYYNKCEIVDANISVYDSNGVISHLLTSSGDDTLLYQGDISNKPKEYIFCRFPRYLTVLSQFFPTGK